MTEEEWKAFDKSKGRLVYAPDSKSGRVVSWRIESACGVGATLSKGKGMVQRPYLCALSANYG